MELSRSKLPEFRAPGPGTWELDAVHFAKPTSRFQAEIHPQALTEGFSEGCRRYGLLINGIAIQFCNGFCYSTLVPAPPEEIPARFEAAKAVFENRLWRKDLDEWDTVVKPASIRTHQALLAEDPSQMTDDALASYIDRCRENLIRMVKQHHQFSITGTVAVGDFMAHVASWTDHPIGDFLALTRGAAPESAGSFHELDALAEAIRSDEAAKALIGSDRSSAAVLDALKAMQGPVGKAAGAYLAMIGNRLLNSLDTGQPAAIEVPDAVLAGIRLAVDGKSYSGKAVSDEDIAALRNKIPAEHHATFNDLFAEVLSMSRLRDERGFYSEVWAGGVMRRALLEAGARLVAKGKLFAPAHLIEAGYDEIKALLQGNGGPSADELAMRASFRAEFNSEQAPPMLGDPPSPPPPLDGLPPDVARVMRAVITAVGSLGAREQGGTQHPNEIRGAGSSPGTYTGTARVITGPDDLGRLKAGDVLVTASTTDSFNIVLPLVGAIVTNTGGLLSHAAIVGREYGVPCVVGARNATRLITDGSRVTVDGTNGLVRYALS
jgi:rifampicin phosphotransferase